MAVGTSVLEFECDDAPAQRCLRALFHAAPDAGGPATLRYHVVATPVGYRAIAPGRPPFGPGTLEAVFAFLEWRATEDVLAAASGELFLHAAGVRLGRRNVLLVGDAGAGKSTLAAHLLVRGHLAWGDDLVRFALADALFYAMPRSWKLDRKALKGLPLVADLVANRCLGTVVADTVAYVSPAAIRRAWMAPPGGVDAIVLLDGSDHHGPAVVERVSEGQAAVRALRSLIAGPATDGEATHMHLATMLENVVAWRVRGADPAGAARALERAAA